MVSAWTGSRQRKIDSKERWSGRAPRSSQLWASISKHPRLIQSCREMREIAVVCLALAGAAAGGLAFQQSDRPSGAKKVDFVRDVQPIFTRSCVACHGPNTQLAGLRLDAKQSVFAKVVVPGNPDGSSLYRRVANIGDVARMPMSGRLADVQIAVLKTWIEQGADWPDSVGAKVTASKTHWAFVPPQRPELPPVG